MKFEKVVLRSNQLDKVAGGTDPIIQMTVVIKDGEVAPPKTDEATAGVDIGHGTSTT